MVGGAYEVVPSCLRCPEEDEVSHDGPAELDRVVGDRLVQPLYQPLVELDRMEVIGYEALARGPQGALQTPDRLFAAARAGGRLVELDWLCRERAVEGARQAGLRHPLSLFVNAEPETLVASIGDAARWREFADVRCFAELTERALVADPSTLLRAVDQVREQDWGVAIDDLGVHPASLALLPMLQPDVIKLDLHLLQRPPSGPDDVQVARVLHAALSQAAATGATVVAEGIETEAQLDLARAYGVHYGQGWLLGRPAPLPRPLASPPVAVPLVRRLLDRSVPPGAFAVVSSSTATRPVDPAGLREVARQLLAQALHQEPASVVLVCVGAPGQLDARHDALLQQLAGGPLTAVLAGQPEAFTAPGVATWPLQPGDPAGHDVDVVVVAPHYAAALVARPSMSDGDGETLDAVLTFDRDLVSAAAHSLVLRLEKGWSGTAVPA